MFSATQPLIGISSGLIENSAGVQLNQISQAYINAILMAGGQPVIVPLGMEIKDLSAFLDRLDGVVLSGGGDIDPVRFGGESHPEVYGISPERDALEIALANDALTLDKPLLAICRGVQVLNVALGGKLHTHIEDQVEGCLRHDWFPDFPRDRIAHPVRLVCGSHLAQIYETEEIQVNSLHHQGVSELGEGLKATGFAPDGLVEGLEGTNTRFVLGVQWHPECLPNDTGSQKLFKAFIHACL
jgi:putative glutamine amidotransferase